MLGILTRYWGIFRNVPTYLEPWIIQWPALQNPGIFRINDAKNKSII